MNSVVLSGAIVAIRWDNEKFFLDSGFSVKCLVSGLYVELIKSGDIDLGMEVTINGKLAHDVTDGLCVVVKNLRVDKSRL